jgi:hypothetical protein
MRINLKFNKEDILCNAIVGTIFFNVFFSFGTDAFGLTFLNPALLNYLKIIFSFLVIGIAMTRLSESLFIKFFLGEALFICLYIYTHFMNGIDWNQLFTYLVFTLGLCIPLTIIISDISNFCLLLRRLLQVSLVNAAILIMFLLRMGGRISYSMPASYQLLLCSVIQTIFAMKKGKWNKLYWVLVFVEVTLIFLKGARGPIFCYAIFIFCKVIADYRNNHKLIVFILLCFISCVVIYVNFNSIMDAVGRILVKYNIYSRSFNQLASNNLLSDSGRNKLHELAIGAIVKNPVIGYGVAGDLKILQGVYVHSLFLELIIDFGIGIGGIVFIIITIQTIKVFFEHDIEKRDIEILLITLGYVMLAISSTYLQNIYLFMFVGLKLKDRKVNFVIGDRKYIV